MVESQTVTQENICSKCGSTMVHRSRLSNNRIVYLFQCKVCRHYRVIDKEE